MVADGLLRLIARHETVRGRASPEGVEAEPDLVTRAFSSARIHTRGKASFRYGRIEVRARLARGQGLWPAIWMLPEHDNYGPYPLSGEIDIAEAVSLGASCDGCEDRLHAAIHHGPDPEENRHFTGSIPYTEPEGFHVFALEWTPDRLTWFLDGESFHTQAGGPPFDQRFYLIINLAVGGRWAESEGRGGIDPDDLPAEFLIDWVRVYSTEAGA